MLQNYSGNNTEIILKSGGGKSICGRIVPFFEDMLSVKGFIALSSRFKLQV